MKAQTLRTVIISLPNIGSVHTALDLLQSGVGLTAVQSGVVAELPIANLSLVENAPPVVVFDGFNWNVFLFVTTA